MTTSERLGATLALIILMVGVVFAFACGGPNEGVGQPHPCDVCSPVQARDAGGSDAGNYW